MSFTVRGQIKRSDNNRGIAGLTVKAYDVDWISANDYLGKCTTNNNGNYSINFKRDDFDAGFFDPEGGPDIIIKIYNASNNKIYESNERSGASGLTVIDVKLNPLDILGEYTVTGNIRDPRSGRYLCNLKVKAYDDDFIFDDYLGKDTTNHTGNYEIPFEHSDFTGYENYPDTYVKVFNNDGRRLAKSNTRWNVPRHSTIDVSLPAQEIDVSVSECIYGWSARYRQEGTHIIVRIKLNPDDDVSDVTTQTLKERWKTGIEDRWSNRFASKCPSCSNQHPLTFEVVWVNLYPHHEVRIRSGNNRSNMLCWDTQDTGSVAAHEFGHMLGLIDEYADANCPDRAPINTGTVMDNNTNVVERHVEHLAELINENAIPITAAPEKNGIKYLLDMKKVFKLPKKKRFTMCHLPDLKERAKIKTAVAKLVKSGKKPTKSNRIIHTVIGGAEGKRIQNRMEISANGTIKYSTNDQLISKKKEYSYTLYSKTVKNLFSEILSSGLIDLKESGGPFLPDSTVGTITLEIDGKTTKYYYLAEKEERRDQNSVMKHAIANFDTMLNKLAIRTIQRDDLLQKRIAKSLNPTKG